MLELRGIDAGYAGHPVLRDVNLTVPDDTVVALLGPNGAGKTTLLRVASGLLRPTAGQILVDGRDVSGSATHELAGMGVCHVPEGRGIFKGLSVADNLRMQTRGDDPAAEQVAMDAFPRLRERRWQLAGTLSGGEQQMLAMAHAYVSDPTTVLLDEVSMGLAPTIVDDIFVRLRDLANRGASLLVVEQYVSRALELADIVYILNRGRVVYVGEPAEIAGSDLMATYLGEGVA